MISKTQREFWHCFNALPDAIQRLAKERFRLWEKDNFNPALHFKPLLGNVWSVRVNQKYRALGRRTGNLVVWFWIGAHEEYNQLKRRLR